ITALAINESAYSAIAMMVRNARIVNAVTSFLRRPPLEGNASVDAFSRAISVVFGDIQNHPSSTLRSRSNLLRSGSRAGCTRMDTVQARLADRERDSKYATTYMTPNTIA